MVMELHNIANNEAGLHTGQVGLPMGRVAYGISEPLLTPNIPRPAYNFTHLAYCAEDSGLGNEIDAYLDTDLTGTLITVTCSIAAGGTDLNEATPRLAEGDLMFVQKIQGVWRCTGAPFMFTKVCACS